MKIGIIGAMVEEVELLKNILTEVETFTEGKADFYHGNYAGHDVYLVKSGIGKVAAAVTTTMLITKFNVDQIWNTGSAGGIGTNLKIGDVVLATKLAYHDVDVTAFDYEYGQMAGGFPLYYLTDLKLVKKAKEVMQNSSLTTHEGLIVSGDQFVHSKEQIEKIKQHFPDALANEMESTAIAQVAYQFEIPVLIVRAISDTADENANVDFDTFIKEAGKNAASMLQSLLEKI